MFNLLRMDLYRMRRSRSAYVCLGILFLTTLASYILLWLLATPQGQETAIRIGMMTAEETQESLSMLEGMDTLTMFRNINLDGGAYCITFGIWVILFVCMDYRSGFLKNIMALYQNRWVYVGSKLLAAALLNILYLISNFLFVVLLNALFGNMVPQAGLGDVLHGLGLDSDHRVWGPDAPDLCLYPEHGGRDICGRSAGRGLGCVDGAGDLVHVPCGGLAELQHLYDALQWTV